MDDLWQGDGVDAVQELGARRVSAVGAKGLPHVHPVYVGPLAAGEGDGGGVPIGDVNETAPHVVSSRGEEGGVDEGRGPHTTLEVTAFPSADNKRRNGRVRCGGEGGCEMLSAGRTAKAKF